ncbi:MAG: tetratricopeptide repeat protein [Ruminococcus sp.]|nr:tetratricopeptide repeat protein [Ruminococcus sp.]
MGYYDSEDFILSDETADKIDELSEIGNNFFDNDYFDKAIDTWQKALSLIPSPHNCYAESVWLMTAIGDTYFLMDDFDTAYKYFENAYTNISGEGLYNPFVLMRFGQCCFELGQKDKALEYLLRAYTIDSKVFEYDDTKYILFLKENGIS